MAASAATLFNMDSETRESLADFAASSLPCRRQQLVGDAPGVGPDRAVERLSRPGETRPSRATPQYNLAYRTHGILSRHLRRRLSMSYHGWIKITLAAAIVATVA